MKVKRDTILYLPIPWRDVAGKSVACLQAEVIASRSEAEDVRHHRDYGPGMISDIEHNLEKIYER